MKKDKKDSKKESKNKFKADMVIRLEACLMWPENQVCAECPERHPEWASILVPPAGTSYFSLSSTSADDKHKKGKKDKKAKKILGVFCCRKCSNYHIAMGRNVCEVKNLKVANEWTEDEVSAMELSGNQVVNAIYEAEMTEDIKAKINELADPRQQMDARANFIEKKYQSMAYFSEATFKRYLKSRDYPKKYGSVMAFAEQATRENREARRAASGAGQPAGTTTMTKRVASDPNLLMNDSDDEEDVNNNRSPIKKNNSDTNIMDRLHAKSLARVEMKADSYTAVHLHHQQQSAGMGSVDQAAANLGYANADAVDFTNPAALAELGYGPAAGTATAATPEVDLGYGDAAPDNIMQECARRAVRPLRRGSVGGGGGAVRRGSVGGGGGGGGGGAVRRGSVGGGGGGSTRRRRSIGGAGDGATMARPSSTPSLMLGCDDAAAADRASRRSTRLNGVRGSTKNGDLDAAGSTHSTRAGRRTTSTTKGGSDLDLAGSSHRRKSKGVPTSSEAAPVATGANRSPVPRRRASVSMRRSVSTDGDASTPTNRSRRSRRGSIEAPTPNLCVDLEAEDDDGDITPTTTPTGGRPRRQRRRSVSSGDISPPRGLLNDGSDEVMESSDVMPTPTLSKPRRQRQKSSGDHVMDGDAASSALAKPRRMRHKSCGETSRGGGDEEAAAKKIPGRQRSRNKAAAALDDDKKLPGRQRSSNKTTPTAADLGYGDDSAATSSENKQLPGRQKSRRNSVGGSAGPSTSAAATEDNSTRPRRQRRGSVGGTPTSVDRGGDDLGKASSHASSSLYSKERSSRPADGRSSVNGDDLGKPHASSSLKSKERSSRPAAGGRSSVSGDDLGKASSHASSSLKSKERSSRASGGRSSVSGGGSALERAREKAKIAKDARSHNNSPTPGSASVSKNVDAADVPTSTHSPKKDRSSRSSSRHSSSGGAVEKALEKANLVKGAREGTQRGSRKSIEVSPVA